LDPAKKRSLYLVKKFEFLGKGTDMRTTHLSGKGFFHLGLTVEKERFGRFVTEK